MVFDFGEPCRRSKTGKKEDNEIRDIFHQSWEKMKIQTKEVIDQINAWNSHAIAEINNYTNQQIHQLQTIYNRQLAIFHQKRDKNISIAKDFHPSKSYPQSKADNPFNDLCNACRVLEFQVARLENIQYQNQRPRVIAIGDQTRGHQQNHSNTHAPGFDDRRVRSMMDNTNATEKHGGNNSRSSFQSSSNGTSESLLSASSPNADNRSTSNSNNSKAEITDVYDSNNKCPICFMIFPLHMSANDRHQHVDEHMPDGENANFTTM